MYINTLHIEKYKVLEKIDITFQTPKDNKNTINVIAGVNGSGKTSLLEWLYSYLGGHIQIIDNGTFKRINSTMDINSGHLLFNNIETLNANNYNEFSNKIVNKKFEIEKVIFFDSNTITKENTQIIGGQNPFENYQFLNYVDTKLILSLSEDYIKKFILNGVINSNIADPQKRQKVVINEFNKLFKSTSLISKLYAIDANHKPIFKTLNGEYITIEQLSSGEKQLYGRVVFLKMLNPKNSIILIDEPDLALHPKWQSEIMEIYRNIGENNQFIITTHSPFIISQTNYKNLIFLTKEDSKIVTKQFKYPPLDRDINTISKTIMDTEYEPKILRKLHLEYKTLFDAKKEKTQKALKLEKEILEWESPNSSFWQGINFDKELRDFE